MSRTSSRPRANVNLPLIALWVASVAVAVIGYLLMTLSNANQAALYTSQTGDYAKLFAAQSGSTVGGLLIAVGVLGVLLALAAQAATRRRAVASEPIVADTAARENDESVAAVPTEQVAPVYEPVTDAPVPAESARADADENRAETVATR